MRGTKFATTWIPRADEHDLAASLGMCDRDRATIDRLIAQAKAAAQRDGITLRVGRWHVWRVVRTMARLGVTNTPDGRAAAFDAIAAQSEDK